MERRWQYWPRRRLRSWPSLRIILSRESKTLTKGRKMLPAVLAYSSCGQIASAWSSWVITHRALTGRMLQLFHLQWLNYLCQWKEAMFLPLSMCLSMSMMALKCYEWDCVRMVTTKICFLQIWFHGCLVEPTFTDCVGSWGKILMLAQSSCGQRTIAGSGGQ